MESNDKFKKMQDEMSRFEEEIGLPLPAPRVISATTYVEAQKQIVGDYLSMLPPPPPPLAFLQRPNIDAFIRAQPAVPTPAAINNPTIAPAMAPYIASVVSGFNPTPATPAKAPAPPPVPEREPSKPPAHAYLTSSSTGPMYPNLSADVKAMQEMHPAPISCDVPDPKKFRKRPLHPSELTYVNARENRRRDRKNKKLIRTAGGQCWEDPTLAEWEDDDFRLFCGDLGNDVTDEVLTRAFSKYHSFLKAKVVRDKRTNKTKGFGFVSFKDPQDFIRATKEMNGRYVGSRPIKLRKSTWKNRALDVVRKKEKEKAHLITMLTGK